MHDFGVYFTEMATCCLLGSKGGVLHARDPSSHCIYSTTSA